MNILHLATFFKPMSIEYQRRSRPRHTDDLDRKLWSIICASRHVLDLSKGEHAVDDLAKDDMLSVEEVALIGRYEKLRECISANACRRGSCRTHLAAVCVRARVGLKVMVRACPVLGGSKSNIPLTTSLGRCASRQSSHPMRSLAQALRIVHMYEA